MTASADTKRQDERAIYDLRSLYEGMGYRKFKMSKFEEYDLYLENKSFLQTEGIITFTGPTGKLLALKPDVTLSILNNVRDEAHLPRKLYYTENVYRAHRSSHEIHEIMQVGLEYVGAVDLYAMTEVVSLAMDSLAALDEGYILDISHMGLVTGLLEEAGLREGAMHDALECISGKNAHELSRLLRREKVAAEASEKLVALSGLGGEFGQVLNKARELAGNETAENAIYELERLYGVLSRTMDTTRLRLDFSIVNDMSYYNGLIFRGYIPGVPEGILAGGQYDNLVRRLSSAPGAIGFAVYLDLLEYREEPEPPFDVDVLIICPGDDKAFAATKMAREKRAEGLSVRAQPDAGKIKARETITL
ncbi:MAG: ATP phosphoribosyltransferase regulatory subunit [Oscillospiraceae bacterium]